MEEKKNAIFYGLCSFTILVLKKLMPMWSTIQLNLVINTKNTWMISLIKKKLNNDISYYLHRPSATDKSMAPEGHDCFYVLVPVPNNQSGIDWSIEGNKVKNLVIDKMEKNLLPNLRENIVEDFYLTPDYFEKETKYSIWIWLFNTAKIYSISLF